MASVLVVNSYFLHLDPKQKKAAQPYPPLATLYICSVLRQQHQVHFTDLMFEGSCDPALAKIKEVSPDYLVICDDGFNYLTKMCLTNMRNEALRLCREARRRCFRIIVSSSDATDHPELYLSAGADYVVAGEAEQTIFQLCSGEKNEADIDGLIYFKENNLVRNQPRKVMRELDEIPFPAWDLLDIEPYRRMWKSKHGYFSLNLVTTRGCPYKCNWCAKPIYGNRYNSRSPGNVVEEIKYLVNRFSPDHFWMCDDIFGLKPGWVREFDQELKRVGLKIRYKIQSRADLLQDDDTVAALHSSGCESVWMGAESGSQKVLDAMDKGITIEEIETATRLLKKNMIRPCFFLQFGYPGEAIEEIGETLKMVDRLKPADIGVSVSYPLPGTRFYDNVKALMGEKKNWTDSDDLDLMFRHKYPSVFYKKLHRFLHKEFRRKQFVDPSSFGLPESSFIKRFPRIVWFSLGSLVTRSAYQSARKKYERIR